MSILFASINRFRDAPGVSVKAQYVLGTGPGGGDGMNFATGAEVFQWNSETVPYGLKPRRIVSLWVDASQLTAGKNLTIVTPAQTIVVAGGSQGYMIATLNAPFTMIVKTNAGTGVVQITAYDFNALFAGTASAGAPVGGGATSSGGGGGGGSFGYPVCFTPDALVRSGDLLVPIGEIKMDDLLLTAKGTLRPVREIQVHLYDGPVIPMRSGCVTPNHWLLTRDGWKRAGEALAGQPRIAYRGMVYNVEMETEDCAPVFDRETEHSYVLACGTVAHNIFKLK